MPELEPDEAEQDYYRVLGLTEQAEQDTVRQRYHALVLKWHPDRFLAANAGAQARAERRMKQLTRAYRVLGNAELRALYDEQRAARLHQTPDAGDGWQPMPGSHPVSPVPPGYAAPAPSAFVRPDENGTGVFFALLCFLIALACLWALITKGTSFLGGTFLILGLAVFGLGGLLFLQDGSFLNRKVDRWMNAEPTRFRQARARAEQARFKAEQERASLEEALDAFEMLVEEALASIPAEFQEQMNNIVVLVEAEPDEELLERLEIKEGHTLLGLYQGVPLTKQGMAGAGPNPERITIFQKPIEAYCHGDPDLIREQVVSTVVHEVAHHFGMDHEEMPIWIK